MPLADHPLPRPEVSSLVIKTTRKIDESHLSGFLNEWAPLSYRIKGFVQLSNGSTVAVHATPGQSEIRQAAYWSGPTELMAITDCYTLREWNRSFREFAEC
jgi:G3E family GTPase